MLRSMDHNLEQIVWAEQTEIELENFLKEFDATVWQVMRKYGYSKDTALMYWLNTFINGRLQEITELLDQESNA